MQRYLQSFSFLFPAFFLGPRALLESLDLGLDGRGLLRVFAHGLVERGLRFGRRLLAPLAIPLPAASTRRRSASRRFCSFSKAAAAFLASRSLILGAARFETRRPHRIPDRTVALSAPQSARSIPPVA